MKKAVTQSITILTLIACTLTTYTTRAALEDELHRLVEQQEHDELAIFLSTHSVLNLEVCDEQNQTPLTKAVLAHDLYSVTLLILAGSCTLPALKTSSLAPEIEENDQPRKLQAAVCAAFLTTLTTPEPSLWKLCDLGYKQATLAIRLLLLLDNPTQEEAVPEAEMLATLLAKANEEAHSIVNCNRG